MKLAKAIQGYRADAAFKTWLHRIAYTTTIDALRVAQRMQAVEPSEIIRLADRTGAVAPLDEGEDGGHIWQAVRSLPGQQRDAILLVYGEDMSHQDAVRVMGCSEKTVSWHVHEAKKKLKILLEAVG